MTQTTQRDRTVRFREVCAGALFALGALLACGAGSTPYMELPSVEHDVYSACSDQVNEWCLEEKFGMRGVGAKERLRITEEHVDECIGDLGEDGIGRAEYVKQGTPQKREAWLLSLGCSQAKIDNAKKSSGK